MEQRSTGARRGAVLTPGELSDVQRALRQFGARGVDVIAARSGVSATTVGRAVAGGSCHRVGLRALVAAARELLAEEGGALAA